MLPVSVHQAKNKKCLDQTKDTWKNGGGSKVDYYISYIYRK